MRYPLDPPLYQTSPFGVPDQYAKFGRHAGLDFAVSTGTPVKAAVSGRVSSGHNSAHGLFIDIEKDGKWYRVMHLSQILVPSGNVSEGQVIGLSGNTGLSTGPHVHFDVRNQYIPTSFLAFVDPNSLLGKEEVVDIWQKLDETNRRLDKVTNDLGKLYEITDNLQKVVEQVVKAGGRLDTDYSNIFKAIEELKKG